VTGPVLALLFPGQGAQHVGMGRALAEAFPEAADTFRDADEILGAPLSRIMWGGPEDELVLTKNAQPAILVHSVAAARVLGDRLKGTAMAAGHSLGEFSAHVVAGTVSFRDALRAVRRRGELMFEAGLARPGQMAAVLGMAGSDVEALCAESSEPPDSIVVPANYNSEGQVVISGDVAAVERATRLAPERGAKRVIALNVSGAFHSPLMEPAKTGLRAELDGAEFRTPRFPVYSNVTAGAVRDAEEARDLLVRQLTEPVRWSECVAGMARDGADRFVELGPGSVLTKLNRRNAPGIDSYAIGDSDDLEGCSAAF
jgi:[acyl-carrier-protein] S-malonyltransferase